MKMQPLSETYLTNVIDWTPAVGSSLVKQGRCEDEMSRKSAERSADKPVKIGCCLDADQSTNRLVSTR